MMEMEDSALEAAIAEKEKLLEDAETLFKDEVGKLQEKYQELMSAKEATEKEVSDSGLKLMRSVKAGHDGNHRDVFPRRSHRISVGRVGFVYLFSVARLRER